MFQQIIGIRKALEGETMPLPMNGDFVAPRNPFGAPDHVVSRKPCPSSRH
jgi:hypothetical protein